MDASDQLDRGFVARCLLRQARWATLSTVEDGQPYASLVTPTVMPDGTILLLLSGLAAHTRHLQHDARCALLAVGAPENVNWQTAPRVTVCGTAEPVADPGLSAAWVAGHRYAAWYADFTDFRLWRVVPLSGLLVAGFGRAMKLAPADFACPPASVAALAAGAPALLEGCDASQAQLLARRALASVSSCGDNADEKGAWRLAGVDVDGFDLLQDDFVLRIAFPAPVASAAEAQAALHRLAAAAAA